MLFAQFFVKSRSFENFFFSPFAIFFIAFLKWRRGKSIFYSHLTMWKLQKFSLALFCKNFVKATFLLKRNYYRIDFTKFFSVREIFLFFNTDHLNFFREMKLLLISINESVDLTEFFKNIVKGQKNLVNFHTFFSQRTRNDTGLCFHKKFENSL